MIDYSQAVMIIVAIFVLNTPLYYKIGKIEERLKKMNGGK